MRQIIAKNIKFGLWYVFSAVTCCLIFIGFSEEIYDIVKKHFDLSLSSPRTDWVIPLIDVISGGVAFFASWILYKRKFGAAVAFWIVTFIIVVQIVIFAVVKEKYQDDIESAIIKWRISEISEFSFKHENYDFYFDEDADRLYRINYIGAAGYYSFTETDAIDNNLTHSFSGTGNIKNVYIAMSDKFDHLIYFITTDGKIYVSYAFNWL
jgi:hypothetical protein